jgi:hypothetical protein
VTNWNAIALQFLPPATFSSTRILAMTHLAIYDSVMAINRDHEPYAVHVKAPRWTSAEAAIAAAAHKVLVNQVPTQSSGLDAPTRQRSPQFLTGSRRRTGSRSASSSRVGSLHCAPQMSSDRRRIRSHWRPESGNRAEMGTTLEWLRRPGPP